MSYDLTIAADAGCSQSQPVAPLLDAMKTIAQITSHGDRHFVLADPPSRWMDIDLELVNEDGDCVDDVDNHSDEINCINLHIPYAYYDSATFAQDYLPVALAIAEKAGWPLRDLQTDEIVSRQKKQPWWRFW